MSLLTKILLSVIVLLFAVSSYLFWSKNNLEEKLYDSQQVVKMLEQDKKALEDRATAKDSAIQNMALRIEDLNKNIAKVEKDKIWFATKYYSLLDTFNVNGGTVTVYIDTLKGTYTFDFDSTATPVSYKGKVTWYRKSNEAFHDMLITIDTLKFKSKIWWDDSSKTVRQDLEALTPGVKIGGFDPIVDSTLYLRLLKKSEIPIEQVILNQSPFFSLWGGASYKISGDITSFEPNLGLDINPIKNISVSISREIRLPNWNFSLKWRFFNFSF